jgi:hypothetical protein
VNHDVNPSGGEAMLSVYPPNPPDYGKSVCRRNQNTFACVFFRHGKPERLP